MKNKSFNKSSTLLLTKRAGNAASRQGVGLSISMTGTLAGFAVFSMLNLAMPASSAWAASVKVCIEGANPPYSSLTPSGDIVGFDVDIGKAIVKKMGMDYQMVKMDWDGIIPALLAKKCDAIISSMAVTSERKKKIDFTEKYYGNPPLRFAGKKDKMTSDDAAAMKGKIVGVQQATINEEYLKQKYPGVKLRSYAKQDDANNDLLAGRIDAVFQDVIPMKEFLASKEAKAGNIALFGRGHNDTAIMGDGAGIGVRKEDTKLRDDFNKAIKALRASGEYKKINDKYFDFDIYQ